MNRALLILVAGCVPDAPAVPSFQQDVQPILAANCVRCHGAPAIGGAPPAVRLDSYEDRVLAEYDTHVVLSTGAAGLHALIARRVASDGAERMPPRFALDDYQIETLARWSASGEGERPPRGAPRPSNHPPTLEVRRVTRAGANLEIELLASDLDGDLVSGELWLRVDDAPRFVGTIRSGTSTLRFDAAALAGSYLLSADLDDGAQPHAVDLGTIDIGGP